MNPTPIMQALSVTPQQHYEPQPPQRWRQLQIRPQQPLQKQRPAQLYLQQPQQQSEQPIQQRTQAACRVFSITQVDADAVGNTVEGMVFVFSREAKGLFDLGSTHSYLSPVFARSIEACAVTTLVGEQDVCHGNCPRCKEK